MNKFFLSLAMAASLTALTACDENGRNPLLLTDYGTPHNVPPFEQIRHRDYVPAIESAILDVNRTVELIASNRNEPTFYNTIIPFDRRNEHLNIVSGIFFNLTEVENCDTMTVIAKTVLPMLNEVYDNIYMNKPLFERIKKVYDTRNESDLDSIQIRVVEKYYKEFARNGALLNEADQEKLREYNKEISLLKLSFGNNVLAETNEYKLVVDSIGDLAGLPETAIVAASEKAKKEGVDGKWLFTLHNASIRPFLTYCDNHELRKQIYEAYTIRGNRDNVNDNKQNVLKLTSLRAKRARLLGYDTHAHYVIANNMAQTPETVDSFLNELWKASLRKAKAELVEMKEFAWRNYKVANIEACDWQYWQEKVRKQKYDIDETEISEYFSLDNAMSGLFDVANKLYGIKMKKAEDMPLYNAQDNVVYEVYDKTDSYVGLVYFDFHPRASKSGGAWCTTYRDAIDNFDGTRVTAHESVVFNFTMPTSDTPALLTFDEVQTLFHEFGHALHGLFSSGQYRATCGVVPSDFVELPSQVLENWAAQPEVLRTFAKHYKTGKVIPDALIEKIKKASTWGQGFAMTELIAAALLDMKWHSIKTDVTDVNKFEKSAMDEIGLISEIAPRYRSTYLSHCFNGGYDAGYYVYSWAELLDADAFGAFEESGDIFNQEIAARFRKYCLSEVGNDEPMKQYERFRGQKPDIKYLLERRGLIESDRKSTQRAQ